jgi:hypothetical protein
LLGLVVTLTVQPVPAALELAALQLLALYPLLAAQKVFLQAVSKV